jgi:hypothetical protein
VTTATYVASSNVAIVGITVSWRAQSTSVRAELVDADSGVPRAVSVPAEPGQPVSLGCGEVCPPRFHVVFSNADATEQTVSFSIQATARSGGCSGPEPTWINLGVEDGG